MLNLVGDEDDLYVVEMFMKEDFYRALSKYAGRPLTEENIECMADDLVEVLDSKYPLWVV